VGFGNQYCFAANAAMMLSFNCNSTYTTAFKLSLYQFATNAFEAAAIQIRAVFENLASAIGIFLTAISL
jgi:hypothetical protein